MKKTTFFAILIAILAACSSNASPVNFKAGTNPKPFEVTVTGHGQPMLFIPGATCSGDEWKESVAHFSKTHECHVFTLAGYAGTAPIESGPYLETFKTELINYIKTKNLSNVILVGHSIGGFLSLWIASELQDHLSKVVIVDALPFFAGTFNPNAKAGFEESQAKSLLEAYAKMDDTQMKANQLLTTRTLCADSSQWNKIATWGAQSDRKTLAYTITEMMGRDLRTQIASVKVPVLVMAAFMPVKQYPQFTEEYVANTFTRQYSNCKTCRVVTSPPAKHFIMYDAPEWFLEEIDTFIQPS
ncbi:MAG: alpha/beta hydrolase [Chitinophagaceae bacterium]|nr:MAG: alpha/beta hydrolase [Chitinophagaceae bacterium]